METLKEFRTILLGQLNIYTKHKNLSCKNFNNDRVLQWRLILEEYGLGVEYIPGEKNISVHALSQLPSNINQETTHELTYVTEIMLELYYIKELPEGNFLLYLKIIDRYQR